MTQCSGEMQANLKLYKAMDKKTKGLFVVDLDGTLLTDDKHVVPKDLEALSLLQQRGYLIAIATGRSNYSFNNLLTTLPHSKTMPSPLPVNYIIFSTGAGIMKFPEMDILRAHSLQADEVLLISSFLEGFGVDYMIHRPIPDTRFFFYSMCGKFNPDFNTRLNMYKNFGSPLSSSMLDNIGGATEILCILPECEAPERITQLARTLPQFSVIKATSPLDGKSIWVEIFSPSASKSQAVKWLAEELGIPREMVCAIGNDYNDEDLLHWAGTGYIVANSPPTMHRDFQKVASNNKAGVSEAIGLWLSTQT